jgi:hypothetical protein
MFVMVGDSMAFYDLDGLSDMDLLHARAFADSLRRSNLGPYHPWGTNLSRQGVRDAIMAEPGEGWFERCRNFAKRCKVHVVAFRGGQGYGYSLVIP